jgi:exonuclease III
MSSGESGDPIPVSPRIHKPLSVHTHSTSNGVHILSINIRCLLAHLDELEALLKIYRPHIVMIQETWLNESQESVTVSGYRIVSRRDRKLADNRGRILTLQRDDFNCLVHIKNCDDEERSYHFLQLGLETILVANWYRPGATEHDGFTKLYDEIREHYQEISGVVFAGDLNVHHRKWLKFSSDNTAVGTDLKAFCAHFGL